MLERRQERHRRRSLVDQVQQQPQENTWRSLVERHARGVVDLDIPAPELRRYTAGERTIRRHQRRRRAVAPLQAVAQQERDHLRLLLRTRAVEPSKLLGSRRLERPRLPPLLRQARGQQRLTNEREALP